MKKNVIQNIFSEVPKTYELINHILTFGLDIKWRKKIGSIAKEHGGSNWLDVCTGTGETVANLAKISKNGTKIFALDFSKEMMQEAITKPEANKIYFTLADVKKIPFPDNYFDVITISFATRNINTNKDALQQSFKEFSRILKLGGIFINLETSQPSNILFKKIFHIYIKLMVKYIGSKISGSKAGYTYLSKTIPKFYNAAILNDILLESGFNQVTYRKMLFGISAIHQAKKIK